MKLMNLDNSTFFKTLIFHHNIISIVYLKVFLFSLPPNIVITISLF